MEKVQVRFEAHPTSPSTLDIPSSPFAVPVNTKRKGLAEVINTVLKLVPPRKFSFYVNGKLLKGTVGKIVKSEEDILVIQVSEMAPKPVPEVVCDHDDWVSCVDASVEGYILTGCYDFNLRVWSVPDGDRINSVGLHDQPIKACCWMKGRDYKQDMYAVSTAKDNTIRSYLIDTDGPISPDMIYEGHMDSVECVAGSPDGSKFASGSWDNTVNVWHLRRPEVQTKKKRKTGIGPLIERAPIVTLRGHTQGVSSVLWGDSLWSGSWDHSMKEWDVESGVCSASLSSSKAASVISCIATNGSEIASGHADRRVRVWDPRSDTLVQDTLSGHEGWVSGVEYNPEVPHLLASIAHDGVVNVWDVRRPDTVLWSPGVVHSDKGLCLSWARVNGGWCIASGGCDNRMVVSKLPIQS